MSEDYLNVDEPNPFTPLQIVPSDYDDCFSDDERAQEQYEAMLEVLWHLAAEFARMRFDPKYFGMIASEVFENSGGLHENMLEQNKNR